MGPGVADTVQRKHWQLMGLFPAYFEQIKVCTNLALIWVGGGAVRGAAWIFMIVGGVYRF